MQSAELTLPQVLLLSRVAHGAAASTSALAAAAGGSLPAASQMIDRLVRLGYLKRTEDAIDRRRSFLTVTSRGQAVLRKLAAARIAEYARGLARASPKRIRELERSLRLILIEFEEMRANTEMIRIPSSRRWRTRSLVPRRRRPRSQSQPPFVLAIHFPVLLGEHSPAAPLTFRSKAPRSPLS